MGIRVTGRDIEKAAYNVQLDVLYVLDVLKLPDDQAILNNEIPLSIGGAIRQSRTLMLLLRKAHLGEVSVTVWPKTWRRCARARNICVGVGLGFGRNRGAVQTTALIICLHELPKPTIGHAFFSWHVDSRPARKSLSGLGIYV